MLKRLGAGSQAGAGGYGVGRAIHQALKEVVAAACQVVQGIGVGAQAVGQVAGALAQHQPGIGVSWGDDGLGRCRDRVQDLLGGVPADCPVITIGLDTYGCRRVKVAWRDAQAATEDHRRHRGEVAVGVTVGETRAWGTANKIGKLPGIGEAVAKHDQG